MFIIENVPLSSYSSMRLGGTAAFLTDINSRQEIPQAISWADERGLPVKMIGGGSNIIWNDDGYPGLVLVNKILGFTSFDMDSETVYITVGAGENWDSVVGRTVEMGLTGVEQLSLIPGTAGATPIQNVGAYGREMSEILTTIEAYDKQEKKFVTLRASECGLGYRTSRFKTTDKDRFFISGITFMTQRGNPQPPFYDSVTNYLAEHQVTEHTAQTIRDAVIAIRSAKLPDPAIVANNGSFFANPFITADHLHQLQETFEKIPFWNTEPGTVKIPAGWLIEQVGMKGFSDKETGMATWNMQALVIVNEHAEHTSDLLKFKQKIVDAVYQKFGITLEQEPELV